MLFELRARICAAMPRVDVGAELAASVKAVGGEVLDENLPAKRDFKNADYRFAADAVIAELKTVKTEVARDDSWLDDASPLIAQWIGEGRVSRSIYKPLGNGLAEFNIGDLPEDCRYELLGVIRNRVFGELFKSASKQIRETRDRLGPADAMGLLLLCIDADTGMSLRVIQHLVGELMLRHGSRNRGIASMVVFSANYGVGLPGARPIRPWMFLRGSDRAPISGPFVRRLGEAWEDRMAAIGGPRVLRMLDGSSAVFDRLFDQNLLPV